MKLKAPVNKNYCATFVQIDRTIPLPNCDNVIGAIIFGSQVIVSKDTEVGTLGLYFPVETKLSHEFLSANNLYKRPELNNNPEEKGYFEDSGRIRCVKFRGNKSEGFFIPIQSLEPLTSIDGLSVGSEFDEINGIKICEKYVPKQTKTPGLGGKIPRDGAKRTSRLVEGQFLLHSDTENLRKNMHKIFPDDIISITKKMHGTSFVTGNVLTKKKLKWYEKLVCKIGVLFKMVFPSTEHSIVYSSRNVIKNEFETKNHNHFYGYDLWGEIKEKIGKDLLPGVTVYGESVGFTSSGAYIQEGFDYGAKEKEHNEYIYKMRVNLPDATHKGKNSIILSYLQMLEYAEFFGLKCVPLYFYGAAKDAFPLPTENVDTWREQFLQSLEAEYLEKDCDMCKNKVPDEGIVLVKESLFDSEAFKLKSFKFLEHETKALDEGVADIESEN